jgi:hypothetical protein
MADGDQAIVVTTFVDNRQDDPKRPCWEIVLTDTHDADDTSDATVAVKWNGLLKKIIFTVPNYTNAITGQVVLTDNGDNTIFDSGEQAKNATYTFNVDEPIVTELNVTTGVSGAAGGTGGDMVVTLRGV